MRVKLRITGRQSGQQLGDVRFIDARILQQAEHPARMPNATLFQRPTSPSGEAIVNERMTSAIEPLPGGEPRVQPEWVARQSHAADAKRISGLHQEAENGGMQMKVQVSIHVVQDQAGGAK